MRRPRASWCYDTFDKLCLSSLESGIPLNRRIDIGSFHFYSVEVELQIFWSFQIEILVLQTLS